MSQVLSSLRQGAAELGLALPATAIGQLVRYLDLLAKWNRVYNLTSIRDKAKMVSHHILDSLAVAAHLPDGNMLDVGSGAGLPGIPLAIACPGRAVTVLDSNQKKGAFLKQAITELGLTNTRAVAKRAEAYRPTELYEIVISRAFSDLSEFVNLAGHLCARDGAMIAMKGLYPADEIAQLSPAWRVENIVRLEVPQLDASRHLVVLRANSSSSPD